MDNMPNNRPEQTMFPATGWLRTIRQKRGQTQAEVAKIIGVKRQAYANFESGEVRSTISLASLRRSAHALECDLVYYLVPKSTPAAMANPPVASPPLSAEAKKNSANFVLHLERSGDELPVELL